MLRGGGGCKVPVLISTIENFLDTRVINTKSGDFLRIYWRTRLLKKSVSLVWLVTMAIQFLKPVLSIFLPFFIMYLDFLVESLHQVLIRIKKSKMLAQPLCVLNLKYFLLELFLKSLREMQRILTVCGFSWKFVAVQIRSFLGIFPE